MPRYITPEGPEVSTEPGSRGRVLQNKLHLKLKRDMDRAEYEALVQAQQQWLQEITEQTQFTNTLLCKMHHNWLGDIYEWGGCYRSVELSKGDFNWPPAFRIPENMARFEAELLRAHTPCRPGLLEQVAEGIAEVHADLLLIHPFREGNGRLARWLADVMALQAGLPPPIYGFLGKGSEKYRKTYLDAVKLGYLGKYHLLRDFFIEAIERSLAEHV